MKGAKNCSNSQIGREPWSYKVQYGTNWAFCKRYKYQGTFCLPYSFVFIMLLYTVHWSIQISFWCFNILQWCMYWFIPEAVFNHQIHLRSTWYEDKNSSPNSHSSNLQYISYLFSNNSKKLFFTEFLHRYPHLVGPVVHSSSLWSLFGWFHQSVKTERPAHNFRSLWIPYGVTYSIF